MKKGIALVLLLALAISLAGCYSVQAADLMEGVTPGKVETIELKEDAARITDFGVRLFQKSVAQGENVLISPLSVISALGMTANGARGETLAEMEQVLGLDVQTLNLWLHSYMVSCADSKDMVMANSIWLRQRDGFSAEPSFLQMNADFYGAGIFQAPFDESTRKDINHWVEEHTDGMIREMLDEIPDSAVMYLINALAFEAEWQEKYEKSDIRSGVFHLSDGTSMDVQMMHSVEQKYLCDGSATGFIKYYKGGRYAFAALLPNENVSLEAYMASLTGESVRTMLEQAENVTVYAATPKFEVSYGKELSEILIPMGMKNAFDSDLANLSGLGSSDRGNLYISRVLHKTYLSLDEKGTKAAAATMVETNDACAMEVPEDFRTVTLDRPFVYMIIDCESNIPIFIGAEVNVEG